MKRTGKRPAGGLSRAAAIGVADRIQSLRLRLDRTRGGFASLLGVPAETVETWESGRDIGRDDLVLISDRTGASLHWLIAGLTPERVEAIRVLARAAVSVPAANQAGQYVGDQDFLKSGSCPEQRAARGQRPVIAAGSTWKGL